ncbi:hypothetical protein [Inhella gelatinilytica]|uniref:Solute-binding protein family 3/N-terminal domain-containing protein n=1 Tax=Inhella gelatinilytica TaxID=2795030 RepID=A0A931IXT2_9BURK|nr:hypothetical protein [Inhella gelatinilytica]MBH9553034.1 hypothetical protein [Inhella gelatinilytica]
MLRRSRFLRRWGDAFVVAIALALSLPTSARAEPQIRWGIVDWPPGFILTANLRPQNLADLGDGQFDRMISELAERMPQYTHRLELMNSTRLWSAISQGEPVCSGPVRKTPERSERSHLTSAVRVAPLSLVVRTAEASAFLGPDGRASLAWLRNQTGLQGRLERERSYGAALDALVGGERAVPREAAVRLGQATEWVAAGRSDYTLEYAHVVEYLRRTGRLRGELSTLPLKEAGEWETAYMVCPRTPWGRAAIAAIDQAIRQASGGRTFREAYLRWMPASIRQAQQGPMNAFYDERASGGPQIE